MKNRRCPECGSDDLEYTTEGLVCQDCGLVVESNLMFCEDFTI